MPAQLPLFESSEVSGARVRITKAGDGLSEALKVTPRALQLGEEVSYVLRGVVRQVNHKADKDDIVQRVHTVEAVAITEVDQDTADKLLRMAAEELERRRAEAADQPALDEGSE